MGRFLYASGMITIYIFFSIQPPSKVAKPLYKPGAFLARVGTCGQITLPKEELKRKWLWVESNSRPFGPQANTLPLRYCRTKIKRQNWNKKTKFPCIFFCKVAEIQREKGLGRGWKNCLPPSIGWNDVAVHWLRKSRIVFNQLWKISMTYLIH